MPVIDRKVRTQIPGRGPSGRGLNRVVPDTSLEQSLGQVGEVIERNAREQQQEEDNNFTYNSITQYNEELIPTLQEEKERTGANTAGNIERVAEKSQVLKNSILEKASPRIQDSLRAKLERIDLANTTELSRLRASGIKVERQNKRDRILDTEKRIVLDSPFKALLSIETIAEMYDDEVDNGIISQTEADNLTEEAANEISVSAITSIGNKLGPTAQLEMLESGMFDESISADQKEQFITEATKLEKAIEKQKKVDANTAEKEAKEALEASWEATEDDFFNRLNDPDDPVTVPEIQQSKLKAGDKLKWLGHVEKNAKDELTIDNWPRYNEIHSELYTEDIAQWTPAKINAEIKKGGISVSQGKSLIATYKSNTKATKEKNPKLGVILKQVDSLSRTFIFDPTFTGGEPTNEQDINNAIRHANVTQAIVNRVENGEDAAVAFEAEMKPYMDEQSKSLLDGFVGKILKGATGLGGVGFDVGRSLFEEPGNESAVEFLNRNNILVNDANIKIANERLK